MVEELCHVRTLDLDERAITPMRQHVLVEAPLDLISRAQTFRLDVPPFPVFRDIREAIGRRRQRFGGGLALFHPTDDLSRLGSRVLDPDVFGVAYCCPNLLAERIARDGNIGFDPARHDADEVSDHLAIGHGVAFRFRLQSFDGLVVKALAARPWRHESPSGLTIGLTRRYANALQRLLTIATDLRGKPACRKENVCLC